MEETKSSSTLSPDPSIPKLIERLEKQVLSSMEASVENLQSMQQAGRLDKETLKKGVGQVLNVAQASLLIRTVPSLLGISTVKTFLQVEDLFKKVHQAAETLKELYQDQAIQVIDSMTAKILEQIQAKEHHIKEQIAKKQQVVAQLVNSKMKAH
jgi:hypothetical protein